MTKGGTAVTKGGERDDKVATRGQQQIFKSELKSEINGCSAAA